MDLLGSIMKSMEKPPTVDTKEKLRQKKAQEVYLKQQNKEKERILQFRNETEKKVTKFVQDDNQTRLKFPPLNKVLRNIVHEISEDAGMLAYSFGEEEVDRYIMVFKKDFPPSEDELNALRNGQEWNDEIAKRLLAQIQNLKDKYENMKRKTKKIEGDLKKGMFQTGGGSCSSYNVAPSATHEALLGILGASAVGLKNPFDGDKPGKPLIHCLPEKIVEVNVLGGESDLGEENLILEYVDVNLREQSKIEEMLDEQKRMMQKRTNQDKPKYNYKEKFQHLVGLEAAEQAARKTETNKSYGFVPSENKKDLRSIEQTLADIREKKRMKMENPQSQSSKTD